MKSIKEFKKECVAGTVFRFFSAKNPNDYSYRIVDKKQGNGVFWFNANGKRIFFEFPKGNDVIIVNGILKIYDPKVVKDEDFSPSLKLAFLIQKVDDEIIKKSVMEKFREGKEKAQEIILQEKQVKIQETKKELCQIIKDFQAGNQVDGSRLYYAYKFFNPDVVEKYHCAVRGAMIGIDITAKKLDDSTISINHTGKAKGNRFFELASEIFNFKVEAEIEETKNI